MLSHPSLMKNTAGYHVSNYEALKIEGKFIQYFEILRGKVLSMKRKDMLLSSSVKEYEQEENHTQ